jgi:hypothetical protein
LSAKKSQWNTFIKDVPLVYQKIVSFIYVLKQAEKWGSILFVLKAKLLWIKYHRDSARASRKTFFTIQWHGTLQYGTVSRYAMQMQIDWQKQKGQMGISAAQCIPAKYLYTYLHIHTKNIQHICCMPGTPSMILE